MISTTLATWQAAPAAAARPCPSMYRAASCNAASWNAIASDAAVVMGSHLGFGGDQDLTTKRLARHLGRLTT